MKQKFEPERTNGSGKPPSLDFIFDQVKSRSAVQDEQISALDRKSNFGLASATLLTAGIAGLYKILSSLSADSAATGLSFFSISINLAPVINFMVCAAGATYLAVVFTTYRAYKIRDFSVVPEPRSLVEKYLHKPEEHTKEVLLSTLLEAFDNNEKLIGKKVFWTNWVLRSLFAEAILLLLMALLQFFLKGETA